MDFVCKLYGNTYAVHVTVALVGVATLNLALPAPPPLITSKFRTHRRKLDTREVAHSHTWGIFIRDTAYFIVIQWSIRSYFIESQWNMPYPVWKCFSYGSLQPPYYVNPNSTNAIYDIGSWVQILGLTPLFCWHLIHNCSFLGQTKRCTKAF